MPDFDLVIKLPITINKNRTDKFNVCTVFKFIARVQVLCLKPF